MKRPKFKPGDLVQLKNRTYDFRVIQVDRLKGWISGGTFIAGKNYRNYGYWLERRPDGMDWPLIVAENELRACKNKNRIPIRNLGRVRMAVWRTRLQGKKLVLNKIRNCLLDISENKRTRQELRLFAAWEADRLRRRIQRLSPDRTNKA